MSNAVAVRSLADMPREPADTSPISLRIPNAWLEEIDALAPTVAPRGMELSRTDVIRIAIRRGLDALHADAPEASAPSQRPRKR